MAESMEQLKNSEKSDSSDTSDTDTTNMLAFFVIVRNRGDQILMRHENGLYYCTHEDSVHGSPYGHAQDFLAKISSHFGISSHIYVATDVALEDETSNDCFLLKILECTDSLCETADSFEWVDWRSLDGVLEQACPHPRVARFIDSYLSNKQLTEIDLTARPWRRIGFYGSMLPWIRELLSEVGYEMRGNPEQVHFGRLSTIFKISTDRGFVFFKAGFKGNREAQKMRIVTNMFPDDTTRLLGMDDDLECRLTEDHGPSVHGTLYTVRTPERPELGETEVKSFFSSALVQLAELQQKSIGRIQELIDNGIPECDKSWIRAAFSGLVSYMQNVGLDTEHDKVLRFDEHLERTFEVWERFNIPSTLVHGDLHNSNIAQPGGLGTKFIFFDWDSAFVGHPFLELYYDEIEEVSLGEDAYLECWKEYGDFESLKRLVLWTRPVRCIIDAFCVSRKPVYTDQDRKEWVENHLEALVRSWDKCDYDSDWGL